MPPINEPILIDTAQYLLHPLRAQEIKDIARLSNDIQRLFSSDKPHVYLPHKQLANAGQAEALLHTALFHQFNGTRQWYLITDKTKQQTIGVIELISPRDAKTHYGLAHYPYILEFCLSKDYNGKGIMSRILPRFVQCLKEKGIQQLGAVVHPNNLKAIKVLQKSGIDKQAHFDAISKLYHN